MSKKYKVYTYDDDYLKESNSIVDCAYHAYMSERFDIGTRKGFNFYFNIKDFTGGKSPTRCVYDSMYMAFVSVFLTRSERDKLIKKIRGEK